MKKNPNVTKLLEMAHAKIESKYLNNSVNSKDIGNAKILQDFLQELKIRAYKRKQTPPAARVQEDFYDILLDTIKLPNNRTLGNLFQRTGNAYKQGYYFEDDLEAVINAIWELIDPDKVQVRGTTSLGQITGSTDLNAFVKDVAKGTIEETAKETGKELKKDYVGFRFGKIDTVVDGAMVNMNASLDIPPGLLQALSNATFTDKSYRSLYNKTENKEVHFGKSDLYRALLGSLSSLGFSRTQSDYIYYAGQNIINGLDTDTPIEEPDFVSLHMYHLKFIYELTGTGIIYKDFGMKYFGGAQYLVFNDPSTLNIFVISTKQIIADMLKQELGNNIHGGIGVSKAALEQMALSIT